MGTGPHGPASQWAILYHRRLAGVRNMDEKKCSPICFSRSERRKIGGPKAATSVLMRKGLEAKLRTKRYPQIVVGSVVEVNVVANFRANPDRSSECFEPAAWINSERG